MARRTRWKKKRQADGVAYYSVPSWEQFHDFIADEMSTHGQYVWRGQCRDTWLLCPGLKRALEGAGSLVPREDEIAHLDRFKKACLGRRGRTPREVLDDNEWWALGQHHGLLTPLLDWTESPFVAAYFAFRDSGGRRRSKRAVWALAKEAVEGRGAAIRGCANAATSQVVEFVTPNSDDNARLISQRGLFSRAPIDKNLDDWVRENFQGDNTEILLKLSIPNTEREKALRMLSRMGLDDRTLFPDIIGAASYANLAVEIKGY